MIERGFFKYFGSKWSRIDEYPAPLHDAIIEPFAGAAGYATRYHDRRVILCDSSPRIVGIWQYLISASPHELRTLPDIGPGQTVDDFAIPQEAKWLIGFWLAPQTSRPMKRACSWMLKGHRPGSYWGQTVRDILARQVDMIRHWKVVLGSYQHIENRRATWFVDPPYQLTRLDSYHTRPNFSDLAQWCTSRHGQTIVCEQAEASWLPFQPMANVRTRHSRTRGATGKPRQTEAIWVNS